jgi:hypothetical protein
MTSVKYIGLDVHKESISICVRNSVGKVVMESVIETKASMIVRDGQARHCVSRVVDRSAPEGHPAPGEEISLIPSQMPCPLAS